MALSKIEDEKIDLVKEFLYESTLKACHAHYDKLVDNRKLLESKAQTTIAVCGIFLAGLFAFIRDIKTLQPSVTGKYLLMLTVALLAFSIFCSILALLLKTTSLPLTGGQLYLTTTKLIAFKAETLQERTKVLLDGKIDFIEEQITKMKEPVDSMELSNEWKVRCLWSAHISLLTAILLVAYLTCSIILRDL